MGNTTRGLPWPNGTDYVVNGDDAIRALAEKLDVVGTYTPGMTNVTLGNGTITGRWWAVGGALLGDAVLTFGTTTTISSPVFIAPPAAALPALITYASLGAWVALDLSATAIRHGLMIRSGNTAAVRNADGTSVSVASPWTWAAGDQIIVSWSYPLSTVP